MQKCNENPRNIYFSFFVRYLELLLLILGEEGRGADDLKD